MRLPPVERLRDTEPLGVTVPATVKEAPPVTLQVPLTFPLLEISSDGQLPDTPPLKPTRQAPWKRLTVLPCDARTGPPMADSTCVEVDVVMEPLVVVVVLKSQRTTYPRSTAYQQVLVCWLLVVALSVLLAWRVTL